MFKMHLTTRSLCLELFSLTMNFFCKMLSMMQILYRKLMVKTFSSDHPGKYYMAVCWKIVLTLVKAIFRELCKA